MFEGNKVYCLLHRVYINKEDGCDEVDTCQLSHVCPITSMIASRVAEVDEDPDIVSIKSDWDDDSDVAEDEMRDLEEEWRRETEEEEAEIANVNNSPLRA